MGRQQSPALTDNHLLPRRKKEKKEKTKPKENPPQTLPFEVICLAPLIKKRKKEREKEWPATADNVWWNTHVFGYFVSGNTYAKQWGDEKFGERTPVQILSFCLSLMNALFCSKQLLKDFINAAFSNAVYMCFTCLWVHLCPHQLSSLWEILKCWFELSSIEAQ